MTLIEYQTAAATREGEAESGDRYLVEPYAGGVLVGVIDGIGHGSKAAEAARAAVTELKEQASAPLVTLFKSCHERLRLTRGAVLSLASFNAREGTMSWLGVGNVEGLFFRADPMAGRQRERLLLRSGMVGKVLPLLQPDVLPLEPGDLLILATDGVRSEFAFDPRLNGPPQKVANHILAWHQKQSDDALVLVARYLGVKR